MKIENITIGRAFLVAVVANIVGGLILYLALRKWGKGEVL